MRAVQFYAIRPGKLYPLCGGTEFAYKLFDLRCFQRACFLLLQPAGHRGGGCNWRQQACLFHKIRMLCNFEENIPIPMPMAAYRFAHTPRSHQKGKVLPARVVQLAKNFSAVAMNSFHHFGKGLNVAVFAHCKLAGGKRSMLFIHTCGLCDDEADAAFGALFIILHHLFARRAVKPTGTQNHGGHNDPIF